MIKTNNAAQYQWKNYGRWLQPTISGAFWCYWNQAQSVQQLFPKTKFHHALFLDGYTLLRKIDAEYMQAFIHNFIQSKSGSLFRIRFEHSAEYAQNLHLSVLFEQQRDKKEYLRMLFYTHLEIIGLWTFVVMFSDELQEYAIQKGILKNESILMKKMNHTSRLQKTWLENQNEEIYIFARIIHRNKNAKINQNMKDAIAEHVAYYKWFGTHHWMGSSYSEKACKQQIQERIRGIPTTQKSQSPQDMIIELLHSFRYWRTHFAEIVAKAVFESRTILQSYAASVELTYNELIYYSHQEILASLQSKRTKSNLPNKDNLKKRMKAFGCFVDENNSEHIIVGKELDYTLSAVIKHNASLEKLSGTVASNGPKVCGKVKIVLEPKDFSKFKQGDILVASETTPDFVPCMKRAAAIITDRGGVTSHAAIVSRELKVPCIIGTKNATAVLKDGIIIEVDTTFNRISIL